MRRHVRIRVLMLCAPLLGAGAPASAIVIGSHSDFQDQTTQNWGGAFPENIPTGGPAGEGDAYLQLTSTFGGMANSRLAIDNASDDWTGDFLAAGVTALEADMINLGTTTLEMRTVLFHGPNERFTSSQSQLLPADGAWHHLVFPIDASSLTSVLGSESYAQVLSQVDNLMFRHQSGPPAAGGTAIATTAGIDNITAVPAPGVSAVLGLAGLGVAPRRRRCKDGRSL